MMPLDSSNNVVGNNNIDILHRFRQLKLRATLTHYCGSRAVTAAASRGFATGQSSGRSASPVRSESGAPLSATMNVNNRPTRVATARAVHKQTPQTDKLSANYM